MNKFKSPANEVMNQSPKEVLLNILKDNPFFKIKHWNNSEEKVKSREIDFEK